MRLSVAKTRQGLVALVVAGLIGLAGGSVRAESFDSFCAEWMGKLAVREEQNMQKIQYAPEGIRINALCPGYFLTDMNAGFFASERGRKFIAELPIGRLGDARELAGAAVFLASDATSYVTGTTLYVDGGHALA